MKKIIAMILVVVMSISCIPITANADSDTRPFLSLGADLNATERAKVLELLYLDEEKIKDYNVISVTNAEEYEHLGSYLSKSVIGNRSLSSVMVVQGKKGSGIDVTCENVTYCTPEMYRNALITAGIEDAQVTVVAPFPISGTAALIGVMKCYEAMTGKELSEEAKDTANNELVVTGDLAENLGGQETAEEFVGTIKQEIIINNITNEGDIRQVIIDASNQYNVNLTDEQIQSLTELMYKISKLDIDVDSIKEQAKGLYDQLSTIKIDDKGFFEKIGEWFAQLWQAITDFFSGE